MSSIMGEKTVQERAVALFNYLKELSALKLNSIVNISGYQWTLYLSELLADDENISITYRDRTEDDSPDEEFDPTIVKIHKPEFQKCPTLPTQLSIWVKPGYDDFRHDVAVVTEIVDASGATIQFDSDPRRVAAYNEWLALYTQWQEKQKIIENTRDIFMSLYKTYIDVNRESETKEVVIADGFLLDKEDSSYNHPLITRRVSISFDAGNNTLSIEDLDVGTELYTFVYTWKG